MPFEDSSPLPISSHPAGIMGGWGGDLSPGLHSGRFIVNEVTFLKGCVLLTAGWTKALVILTKKKGRQRGNQQGGCREWKTEGQEQRRRQRRQLGEEGGNEGELSPKMVRELRGEKVNE